MFQKLYRLIFGLEEFTKTKIELRFELAKELTDKLDVQSIEDFDLLESCIYKIKDQLRVKSSNLNTTIKNPNNSLTKKDVEEFLQILLDLRSSFLNTAFKAIQKQVVPNEGETSPNSLSISTSTYSVSLSSDGGLHAILEFKEDIEFKQIRIISSLLYDITNAQGTTIIVENTTVFIIVRTQDDGIIKPLPQKKDNNEIEEVFTILTSNHSNTTQYLDDVEKKQKINSKYRDEQNLDALISTYQQSSTPSHFNEEQDNSLTFEKDDSIELETKEEKNPNEVSIEKTDSLTIYKDEQIIVEGNEKSPLFGEIQISSVEKKPMNQLDDSTFSYLFLFSKIFASIVFDVLESHGTNIIWDENETSMKIISRFKDDNAMNPWTPQQIEDEQLNQVQQTLLQRLAQEFPQQQPQQEQEKKQEEEKPIKINEGTKDKAKYLLDELRKIP